MKVHVTEPPKRWNVIIGGPIDAARDALATHVDIHRPLRNVSTSGYGAIHATIWADRDELERWFRATHARGPGSLLFYMSDDDARVA